MRSSKVLFALLLLAFMAPYKTFAQLPLSDKASISLLTCGPGDELYSIFGHTALRVYDPASATDIVFNYGTFDFDTPNFYMKFVQGDLKYFVSVSSYRDFVDTYKYFERDVYEQVLNLTPGQKQKIANHLTEVLTTDKRFYTYKFIHRNCTTMVADVINETIPQKISLDIPDKGKTYRKILYGYVEDYYFENLGISLAFGHPTDDESNLLFLPLQLLQGVEKTTVNGKPLAQPVIEVYKTSLSQAGAPLWNNIWVFSAALLVILLFSGNRTVYMSFLALSGLLGLLFAFLGFFSQHGELLWNYNTLLLNPLFLVLLYFIIRNNRKWIVNMAYLCLGLIVVYMIIMANKPHLVAVLPIIVLIVGVLVRILIKARKAPHLQIR